MTEKMMAVDEGDFSINDEILKALTGKVAETGSALNESAAQLKKLNEMASRLPYFEKRLEALEDGASKVKQSMEEGDKGLKEGINGLGAQVGALAVKVSMPAEAIGALRQELVNHARLFEKPLHKEVHYRHILGRPIVVLVLALVGAIFMFGLWQDARNQLSAKEENDIKYRYMKLSGDSVIAARVNSAEEAWRADPDQFRKTVEADEELMSANTANYLRKERLDSETRELRRPKRRQ